MILAAFPTGVANITVNGLHQWDYGQQLKIKAADLPAMIEVHFACAGMDEAIVRSCSMVGGEGTVAIPDKCLEQTSPVYAWIYEINGTAGTTTKTILLNILERTRPQTGEDIPVEISDKYTEAVTAMNEAVGALQEGGIKTKYASHSDTAGYADTAGHADTAGYADTAGHADTAGATSAIASTPTHYSEQIDSWRQPITEPGLYSLTLRSEYKFGGELKSLNYTLFLFVESIKGGNYFGSCITVATDTFSYELGIACIDGVCGVYDISSGYISKMDTGLPVYAWTWRKIFSLHDVTE